MFAARIYKHDVGCRQHVMQQQYDGHRCALADQQPDDARDVGRVGHTVSSVSHRNGERGPGRLGICVDRRIQSGKQRPVWLELGGTYLLGRGGVSDARFTQTIHVLHIGAVLPVV